MAFSSASTSERMVVMLANIAESLVAYPSGMSDVGRRTYYVGPPTSDMGAKHQRPDQLRQRN